MKNLLICIILLLFITNVSAEISWFFTIFVNEGEISEGCQVGVALDASDELDEYDIVNNAPPPPPTGNYFDIYLFNPQWNLSEEKYFRDIRNSNYQTISWDIQIFVDSVDDFVLTWSDIQNVPDEIELFLEINENETLNLRETDSLTIVHGSVIYDYVLRIENNASNKDNSLLEEYFSVYPNPVHQNSNLFFEIPEDTSKQVIEIFNIKGQKINQIHNLDKNSYWNIKNNHREPIKSGIYIIRLNNGEKCYHKKVIVLP